jgi:hypothetical protein
MTKPPPNTLKAALARWRRDPVAFITEVLLDPGTSAPFELYPAQVEFLRAALRLTAAGRLPCPEMLFSAPKKSGKTALAAMIAIYVAVVLGGPYAEVYCLANDYEQAASRVFQSDAARLGEDYGEQDRVHIDRLVHPGVRQRLQRLCRRQSVADHLR